MINYSSDEVAVLSAMAKGSQLTVNDIREATHMSLSKVRNVVKFLEKQEKIERVDKRVPFIYQIRGESSFLVYQQKVSEYRALLLDKKLSTDKTLVLMLRQLPKAEWMKLASEFHALAETVEQLNGEGKLFDTL